ncbi:hypothetical protein SAY87_027975 [Trapa incisa]|uniref:Uncharacterized protein n=1 Tax=Trapa incisa TaxID=236973 RepID=A0AAN7L185_9MYRT|nr:hypothetical protein SAY87_027975 [Trapa incisa]
MGSGSQLNALYSKQYIAMLEQDSDIYKWGQSIFETSPMFITGYLTDSIDQDSNSIYHINYPMTQYGTEYSHVKDDEIFLHLAMRGTEANYHVPEQESSIQVDQHGLQSLPMRYYYSDHNYDNGEPGSIWAISSPSTYGEGYTYPQNPNNDSEDGEFGSPLDQLVPIPHVPRLNGEIPSVDEASSDYERLHQGRVDTQK